MPVNLVRHTAVAVEPGLCYGVSEIPLTDGFDAAARQVRARLPGGPLRVVSSPTGRCLRLAACIAAAGELEVDARLRELDFGAWEGRRWNDLPRAEVDVWSADFVDRAPPGGESFSVLAARAEACLAECTRRHPNDELVLVTHAGVIRALLAPRRGLTLGEAFTLSIDFGGVYPLPPPP